MWIVWLSQIQTQPFLARHPNPEQSLQLCALYDADPQDTAGFRRMLYCGTEDQTGHYKELVYGAAVVAVPGDLEGWWSWRATFVPSFQDPIADPASPPDTEWGNTLVTPYPAVTGVLRAKTDAYWYDACAHYRAFVARTGIAGLPIEQKAGFDLGQSLGLFGATIQQSAATWSGPALYQRILWLQLQWAELLANPFVPTTPSYMHLQTYEASDIFEGGVADEPVEETVGRGVKEMLAEAWARGIRGSPYTFPGSLEVEARWNRYVTPEMQAWQRDGMPEESLIVPVLARETKGTRIDYGSPSGQALFPFVIDKALVERIGFGGIYNDVYSGSGPHLSYDPPPPYARQHPAHGGDYWVRGKAQAIRNIRAMLQQSSPGDAAERLARSFVLSEIAEEFVAIHLDLFQDGYDWYPEHLLLAEDLIYGPGIASPDVPAASKCMALGLWTLVYHEYAPSRRFGVPFTDIPLARNARWHSAAYPGMSPGEWRELACFLFATTFTHGNRVAAIYHTDFDSPAVVVENGVLEVDRDVDPEGVGLDIVAFCRTLLAAQERAHAGRFVVYGRMERPLQIDWGAHPEMTCQNPVAACVKTDPALALVAYPFFYDPVDVTRGVQPGFGWGTLPFPVPCVQHTVWRSPQGAVGIVLVRWTEAEAPWVATVDPTLYGFSVEQALAVRRLSQGEEPEVVGRAIGTFALGLNDARDPALVTVDAGELAPRAILVLELAALSSRVVSLGRRIALRDQAAWQSAPVPLCGDNAAKVTVTAIMIRDVTVEVTLWAANHPLGRFVPISSDIVLLTKTGQSVGIDTEVQGFAYVQERLGSFVTGGAVLAAMIETYRA